MMPLTRTRIDAVADVLSGYAARTSLEDAAGGAALALQPGGLPARGEFDAHDVEGVRVNAAHARALLRPSDVVFSGRGEIRASVYQGGEGAVLAIAPLIIIRPRGGSPIPAFIALQLTAGSVSERLRARMQGSAGRFIGKGDVAEAEIGVPDLATQRRLVELRRLMDKEEALLERLAERRAALFGALLDEACRLGSGERSEA